MDMVTDAANRHEFRCHSNTFRALWPRCRKCTTAKTSMKCSNICSIGNPSGIPNLAMMAVAWCSGESQSLIVSHPDWKAIQQMLAW